MRKTDVRGKHGFSVQRTQWTLANPVGWLEGSPQGWFTAIMCLRPGATVTSEYTFVLRKSLRIRARSQSIFPGRSLFLQLTLKIRGLDRLPAADSVEDQLDSRGHAKLFENME